MKPWEKYQQSTGPWERFAEQQPEAPARPKRVPIMPMSEYEEPSFEDLEAINAIKADAGKGIAETIASGAASAADAASAGWRGLAAMVPGGMTPKEAVDDSLGKWRYEPESESGRDIEQALNTVGEAADRAADLAGEKSGKPTDTLGATLVKTALLGLPMLLGARSSGTRRGRAPSTEELGQRATAAYKAADDAGLVVSRDAYSRAVQQIQRNAAERGIDKGIHKKSFRALKRIMDDDGENISLKGLQRIRQNINDAVAAAKSRGDRREALIIRNEFDDFIKSLKDDDILTGDPAGVDQFYRGNELYARKAKAQEIEGLVDKARNAAPNFSASGYENALRTKLKQLADNDNRMRRFSPEEQKLITRAARGTATGNTMRNIGRFAPTGVVSTALTAGPAYMVGGPGLAAAVAGLGYAGRGGALVSRNAQIAKLLDRIRRGETVSPNDKRRAIATLMLSDDAQ